jgi:hypothetical protein
MLTTAASASAATSHGSRQQVQPVPAKPVEIVSGPGRMRLVQPQLYLLVALQDVGGSARAPAREVLFQAPAAKK